MSIFPSCALAAVLADAPAFAQDGGRVLLATTMAMSSTSAAANVGRPAGNPDRQPIGSAIMRRPEPEADAPTPPD
jgi:hypothetical protein